MGSALIYPVNIRNISWGAKFYCAGSVFFSLFWENPIKIPANNKNNINCQLSIGTGGLLHQGGGLGPKQAGFGGPFGPP
jgi:hypothetical protein